MSDTKPKNLWGYAVFAGTLSAAGLPIYIHAPKFYADNYAVSLGALGTILFALCAMCADWRSRSLPS